MKGLKIFLALAVFAFAVLGAAAVWMGGLNQDEGWYLYAANLIAEGKMPYRDFFYTQGPMLPICYSSFTWVWRHFGLLGARVLTLAFGCVGIVFFVALARRLAPAGRRNAAGLVVLFLLATNLYHLYYLAIPKTYALAALFVSAGFYNLSFALDPARRDRLRALCAFGGGLLLAFAAGTRISLGALLCTGGVALLWGRQWKVLAGFCAGGFGGLALVYGPFLLDSQSQAGLLAAQAYHMSRGGFDLTWTVGSLSRLVRWYLPVFVVFGLGVAHTLKARAGGAESRTIEQSNLPAILLWGFLAVLAVQMLAPFPYEDYQVPIMGLIAVYAAVNFVENTTAPLFDLQPSTFNLLLVLGLCFANSFGSPLLERWSTNGQDRFWSLKKAKTELAQLREVARRIERLDPGGTDLFTQDLYLAIETNRKVPEGFEMGPFSYWGKRLPVRSDRRLAFDDAAMRRFLAEAPCAIAALSGYTFAITVPEGVETPLETQMAYWDLLKKSYECVGSEEAFGQNSTTLLLLRRK